MLFMYWTNPEIELPPAVNAWRNLYPEFRVFDDNDVEALLKPEFIPVFRSIRLPSAKSDLARFLLLREHGGFYIDAHMGPTAPARLLETLEKLTAFNLILFGQGWKMKTETDFDLMNGAIAARKGAPELDLAIDRIIYNILDQRKKELQTQDYVSYNLFYLTGTYILLQAFFDDVRPRFRLNHQFESTIFVHFMKDNLQSGFEIGAWNTYRKPDGHWSERQQRERFFIDL